MQKEKQLVPKLRFPEFDEEWSFKKIEKSFLFFNGYAFSSKDSTEKGVLWVKIADVGIQNMKKDNLSYLPESFKEKHSKFLLKSGDYVVALTRPILSGKLKISKVDDYFHNSLLNQRVGKIISEEYLGYIYYLLQNERLIKSIENNIAGTDPPNLSQKEINNIKVGLPKRKEQQKIANFLTAIDHRIQTLEQKKTLLEHYKKGVMQKIFKQELRFRDDSGDAFPEWEVKKLGEVCEKKSSNISANKIEDNFGEYLIYGASGILKKVDFYEEENDYVSIIKDGAGVGRIVYCKGKSSVLGTMEIIKSNSNVNTYFLYCLLENINFKKYITGSTIPHIYFKDYKKENIKIPSLPEQTKIANFLSAIDKNIALVNTKIEHTKAYKKGLLQQMFV